MAPITERDSLLPRATVVSNDLPIDSDSSKEPANDLITEKKLTNRPTHPIHNRSKSNKSIIFALCIVAILVRLLLFPASIYNRIYGGSEPNPQTIEQRVTKILTHTPLIGMASYLFQKLRF
jgi:hypothetical protein